MPSETIRIAIPDDEYLAVTAGHFNVLIRPTAPVALRLHVGAVAPAAGTTHFLPISTVGVSLSDLEGGDNVYLMAEGAGAEVVVIRGG